MAFQRVSAVGMDSRPAIFGTGSDTDLSQDRPGQIDVSQPDLFEYGRFGIGC
jgi:hypothetical protein